MLFQNHTCPQTGQKLEVTQTGLLREDKRLYPFIEADGLSVSIPDFVELKKLQDGAKTSLQMYETKTASEFYRNFLNWLFDTFETNETEFRKKLIGKMQLKPGQKVLVTGCGLGEDLSLILEQVGDKGEVHGQDLSAMMVYFACNYNTELFNGKLPDNIYFSVGDATQLPYESNYFDAVFHFGGINLFDDIQGSISEMHRVVKVGGNIVFGDEGIGPWLKETEYAKIVINNNQLWKLSAPIDLLPAACGQVSLDWVLGNCFWVIAFSKIEGLPQINMDVPHLGRRGGSMRTRYFGQLEGVTESTKAIAQKKAADAGLSLHEWLEKTIQAQ